MALRRALHFVFKVGARTKTATFYRDVLGMKILRHEEFEEGCKTTCNGPYDGKWSKTMGLTLQSSQAVSNAKRLNWPLTQVEDCLYMTEAPGGYRFYLIDKEQPNCDPVQKVSLAVSDLQRSVHYWSALLGMKVIEKNEDKKIALMGFSDNQCKLELQDIGGAVDHGTAFGRIAFACPRDQLPDIEALMKKEKQKILTPLVSLDTPGKPQWKLSFLQILHSGSFRLWTQRGMNYWMRPWLQIRVTSGLPNTTSRRLQHKDCLASLKLLEKIQDVQSTRFLLLYISVVH